MKRILLFSFLAVFVLAVSGVFAGGQTESSSAAPKKVLIGISKIVQHPALDAVEQGIQDELKAEGVDAEYDLQNANGDINTAASIANKFKAEKVAVAVGIATPTAQALANALKEIPVVYSAVTDPVSAGLVASFDKGGANVTGVSDLTPVKQQIQFLTQLKPIKRLGHVYSSGEANAVVLAKLAEQACKELGIEFVPSTVTNSSEVKQATETIIGKVDGIYVSTDNTVVSALSALIDVAMKNKIPVMSADPSSAEKMDVLAAWGFDYYKMGRATGRMVNEILNGKKTADIPTKFMTDPTDVDLLINLDVAKQLGISIPQKDIDMANSIVQNGQLTKK
ncbi:MAG TPA: ABC transporter substrate-binding protein [Spirochaetia bacterium]|nr:ABC transporter substrate-binding protein [Spirochaetia bacterium]